MGAKFDQHFLADPGAADTIVRALGLRAGEDVVEIGPGRGVLTERLLWEGAKVTAIEVDPKLAADLTRRLKSDAVRVYQKDFLYQDLAVLPSPCKVVSNLPYSAGAPITLRLMEWGAWDTAVLMYQKEVAERVVAGPGGRDYGPFSLAVQLWADAEYLLTVTSDRFRPAPKVDSGVVRLTRRQPALPPPAARRITKVVRRRSPSGARWRQVLAGRWARRAKVDAAFAASGLDVARAEAIPLGLRPPGAGPRPGAPRAEGLRLAWPLDGAAQDGPRLRPRLALPLTPRPTSRAPRGWRPSPDGATEGSRSAPPRAFTRRLAGMSDAVGAQALPVALAGPRRGAEPAGGVRGDGRRAWNGRGALRRRRPGRGALLPRQTARAGGVRGARAHRRHKSPRAGAPARPRLRRRAERAGGFYRPASSAGFRFRVRRVGPRRGHHAVVIDLRPGTLIDAPVPHSVAVLLATAGLGPGWSGASTWPAARLDRRSRWGPTCGSTRSPTASRPQARRDHLLFGPVAL